MSPGPDFLVVSKNSISHSRKIGIYTAIGVALGNCVHVTYTILGLGILISQSIIAFSVIKFAGAVYLVYLGVTLMTEKDAVTEVLPEAEQKSPKKAFREGFFTNVLNPKATLFFVSIFSQFVSPKLPLALRATIGIEVVSIVGAWFLVLAFVLTYPRIRNVISLVQAKLLKVMGAALLLLGVKLASLQQ